MSEFKKIQILVTGADGFIGSHLTEALVLSGANVTALCQYNSFGGIGWLGSLNASVLENITVISGDIRDSGFVSDIVKNQDVVFHLAALIGIPYSYIAPRSYAEVNITGTITFSKGVEKQKCSTYSHLNVRSIWDGYHYSYHRDTSITGAITLFRLKNGSRPYGNGLLQYL